MRAALALMLAACASTPAAEAPELVVVAHQDDDLLFMQSDIYDVVHAGHPIVVVYVTAGDGGNGPDYVASRERAVRAAYGMVAGSQRWTCHDNRCRLDDRPVTLVFLGNPDGGINGDRPMSLLSKWQGVTPGRDDVIAAVTKIIDETRPATIRTLEISGTHGYDHSDHMMVGALTQLALARSSVQAELLSYRGYNINDAAANVADETVAQSSLFFRAYMACMTSCGGVCGKTPCPTVDDGWYAGFLHRRYVVTMQDVTGALSSPTGCIGLPNTSADATVVNCDAAAELTLDDTGLVHLGELCLEVDHDNTISAGGCEPAPNRFFQLDSEGHLWSGAHPPSEASKLDHTPCVFVDGGAVTVGTCGADRDFRWKVTDPN